MSQQVPRNMHPIETAPENAPILVSRPWGPAGHAVAMQPVFRRGVDFYYADGEKLDWEPTAWVAAEAPLTVGVKSA